MFNWWKKIKDSALSIIRSFRPVVVRVTYHRLEDVNLEDSVVVVPTQLPLATQEPESISALQIAKDLGSLMCSKDNLPGVAAASILTAVGTGVNFLGPYLLGETMSLLSQDRQETINILGVELNRAALISLLVTAYGLSQIIPNLREQMMVPVTNRNVKKIIVASTAHLLEKSLNYHVNTPIPAQIYFIQKGFSVSTIGAPILTQVAPILIEIGIASTILSSQYGFEMGLGLVGLVSIYTAYSAISAKSLINARESSLKEGNEAWDYFLSALAQYKTMRDFGKFDHTMKGVSEAMDKMIRAEIKAAHRPLQVGLGHTVISRSTMLAALLYIGAGVQSGKFSAQDFVVLFGYLNQLSGLLPAFGQAINQVFAAYPDLKFVLGGLAEPKEVIDLHPDNPLVIDEHRGPSIEFRSVSFSYPSRPGEEAQPPLFKNLSFKVHGGQKVAFVSESGAGKTTIFNLLYGYYKPISGTILINDQDISLISLESLQSKIILFGQNPNLFKGSIRDNICYGATHSEEVTDEMIWALAREANLFDFLNSFPQKLKTDVGEGGKQLSGGQQQKVAILRALFKEGAIRLLDEITAPCDSQSAEQVLQGVERTADGQTCLMITHKLTEAQQADLIFVLRDGGIVASGTHEELLENCELYQKLWLAYTKQDTGMAPSSTGRIINALGGHKVAPLEVTHAPKPLPSLQLPGLSERILADDDCEVHTRLSPEFI
jgi:ABC-type multidrug transport system fused ATPase/permease subunit